MKVNNATKIVGLQNSVKLSFFPCTFCDMVNINVSAHNTAEIMTIKFMQSQIEFSLKKVLKFQV